MTRASPPPAPGIFLATLPVLEGADFESLQHGSWRERHINLRDELSDHYPRWDTRVAVGLIEKKRRTRSSS